MKKNRFSEQQILKLLKEAEAGAAVQEVCRPTLDTASAPGSVRCAWLSKKRCFVRRKSD